MKTQWPPAWDRRNAASLKTSCFGRHSPDAQAPKTPLGHET